MKPEAPSPSSGSKGTDAASQLQHEAVQLDELRQLQAQRFQALNQLAAGVAHEFNNLIAGILGSAELVAMDVPEGYPGHETLKQIFEASNNARDFVHKLRCFGQRPPPEFKPVRLQQVIEETVPILKTIIPDKVELVVQADPDCPKASADSAQIHQAILDLCLYCWHSLADRRGQIKISLENNPATRLPANTPCPLHHGSYVCLTVQDNGPGMEKSAAEKIFHPFRNRRSGGTKMGLELFMVRETIQGHHGEIVLESEPGQGQAFRIYLPAAVEK